MPDMIIEPESDTSAPTAAAWEIMSVPMAMPPPGMAIAAPMAAAPIAISVTAFAILLSDFPCARGVHDRQAQDAGLVRSQELALQGHEPQARPAPPPDHHRIAAARKGGLDLAEVIGRGNIARQRIERGPPA